MHPGVVASGQVPQEGQTMPALQSKGRKDGLGPAAGAGSGLAHGAMSLQGSAWLLLAVQGHCFGGQTQASFLCSGIYPGSSIKPQAWR